MKRIDPSKNYSDTRMAIGYVSLSEATPEDYKRIGFKSGLEVHQQLLTTSKLFCRCPAGIYNDNDDYNAEVIRHMRPTLSELGEYDGTALMEFKTRKEIVYRINSENSCTYEVDDTPPFPIDREALEIALKISILSKLNIVGEVHITRKQYLDGSIPTGFQRTAILGVNGEIELSNKKVRLIQLSIEEDSCREISDIGHERVYKTDRLGMPLIETVTYPDMETPWELSEAAEYIRFLNRSTGNVRTGIGSGREDVNVSCEGGTRVEIKGVSHNAWIPRLSHNEAFRQYALLNIRSLLKDRLKGKKQCLPTRKEIEITKLDLLFKPIKEAFDKRFRVIAINLPYFEGILSHFTQPGRIFADEISERLKVIACIDLPNMIHSEELEPSLTNKEWVKIRSFLESGEGDAQLLFWGPDEDIQTAIETIEERIEMAFSMVPNETRKSLPNGTTIFERVLPGSDRMYPDTDSPPIPLEDEYLESIQKGLPVEISERFRQMKDWGIPEDTFTYLLSKNLPPLIERISTDFDFDPGYLGRFLGHKFKNLEGTCKAHKIFTYDIIYKMFGFIHTAGLIKDISGPMINILYEHPKMRYESILNSLEYKKRTDEEIVEPVEFLYQKFRDETTHQDETNAINWIMGQIRGKAIGNIDLTELRKLIEEKVKNLKN